VRRIVTPCVLGTLVAALGCPAAKPSSARVRLEGRAVGAKHVLLWNPEADVKLDAMLAADGGYTLEAPLEAVTGARILAEGAGGATTTSGKLAIAPLTTSVAVTPLPIWPCKLDAKREGDKLRFSWPPLAGHEGLRYSLIFAAGEHEASLVTREPEAVQTLAELDTLLAERDPAAKTLLVRVRAFENGDANGPTWAGEPLTWEIPADFPRH
jgi:hypothetical protein